MERRSSPNARRAASTMPSRTWRMRSGTLSCACMLPHVLCEADAVAIGIDDLDLTHGVRQRRRAAIDGHAGLVERGDLRVEIGDPDVHVPNPARSVRLR